MIVPRERLAWDAVRDVVVGDPRAPETTHCPVARFTAWAPTCKAGTWARRAVAARIRSSQVHINHPAWNPMAPFGGYKPSGNGREYGVEGLHEFLEINAVLGYGHEST